MDFSAFMITAYHFPFWWRSTALSGELLHKYSGIVPYCFFTYSKISSLSTIYSHPWMFSYLDNNHTTFS
ncbi:hypothetical protein BN165_1040095 [Clostridioides difficile E1]|nr:hypothetical protein BN163_1140023 [Clostridioides difficile T5]CCK94226.1 hypothetical protein BN165_1040095 [Clostridioides difficile E1]